MVIPKIIFRILQETKAMKFTLFLITALISAVQVSSLPTPIDILDGLLDSPLDGILKVRWSL